MWFNRLTRQDLTQGLFCSRDRNQPDGRWLIEKNSKEKSLKRARNRKQGKKVNPRLTVMMCEHFEKSAPISSELCEEASLPQSKLNKAVMEKPSYREWMNLRCSFSKYKEGKTKDISTEDNESKQSQAVSQKQIISKDWITLSYELSIFRLMVYKHDSTVWYTCS